MFFDIVSIGSATVDSFSNIDSCFFKKNIYSFKAGNKILLNSLNIEIGGSATNTAVSFSRLGLKTSIIIKIGIGNNSKRVLSFLRKEKVNLSLLSKERGRTGFSFILDCKNKDRIIFTYKGSNNHIFEKDINWKLLKKTKWIYFGSLVGDSFKTQQKIISFAKKNKILLAYNLSSYLCNIGLKKLDFILKNIDILFQNKQELFLLTKITSLKKAFQKLQKYNIKYIVITNGNKKGFILYNKKIISFMPLKIKIVDTTGAGDAFSSTFLAYLIKGRKINSCIKAAIINSSNVVQYIGCKKGLLTYEELEKKIKKTKIKIE